MHRHTWARKFGLKWRNTNGALPQSHKQTRVSFMPVACVKLSVCLHLDSCGRFVSIRLSVAAAFQWVADISQNVEQCISTFLCTELYVPAHLFEFVGQNVFMFICLQWMWGCVQASFWRLLTSKGYLEMLKNKINMCFVKRICASCFLCSPVGYPERKDSRSYKFDTWKEKNIKISFY